MSGQRNGYVRVSSFARNPERQWENVELERVFTDRISGKDGIRPQLEAPFTFVRDGETRSYSARPAISRESRSKAISSGMKKWPITALRRLDRTLCAPYRLGHCMPNGAR